MTNTTKKPIFMSQDFESAFGITRHDYKDECRGLTWRESSS